MVLRDYGGGAHTIVDEYSHIGENRGPYTVGQISHRVSHPYIKSNLGSGTLQTHRSRHLVFGCIVHVPLYLDLTVAKHDERRWLLL